METRWLTDLRAVHDSNEAKQPAATEAAEDGEAHVALRLQTQAVVHIGRRLGAHHLEMQGGREGGWVGGRMIENSDILRTKK